MDGLAASGVSVENDPLRKWSGPFCCDAQHGSPDDMLGCGPRSLRTSVGWVFGRSASKRISIEHSKDWMGTRHAVRNIDSRRTARP
jgi:hypothetical protein